MILLLLPSSCEVLLCLSFVELLLVEASRELHSTTGSAAAELLVASVREVATSSGTPVDEKASYCVYIPVVFCSCYSLVLLACCCK